MNTVIKKLKKKIDIIERKINCNSYIEYKNTNLKSYYRYREFSMNIFIRNLKPRKNQQN